MSASPMTLVAAAIPHGMWFKAADVRAATGMSRAFVNKTLYAMRDLNVLMSRAGKPPQFYLVGSTPAPAPVVAANPNVVRMLADDLDLAITSLQPYMAAAEVQAAPGLIAALSGSVGTLKRAQMIAHGHLVVRATTSTR